MGFPGLDGLKMQSLTALVHILVFTGIAEGQTSYCTDSNTPLTRDGYIVTRRTGQSTYSDSMACEWSLDAGEGNLLRFTVETSYLEPAETACDKHDYVTIYDGGIDSSDFRNTSWCGDDNPRYFTTSGRYGYVTFRTNSRDSYYSGVRLKYETFNSSVCPAGWSTYNASYCLMVKNHFETWEDAHSFCANDGSNLASISSVHEQNFISGMRSSSSNKMWVGFKQNYRGGDDWEWKWINTSIDYLTDRWMDQHHKKAEQQCIGLIPSSNSIDNDYCSSKKPFVCKSKIGNRTIFQLPKDKEDGEALQWHWILLGVILFVAFFWTGARLAKRHQERRQSHIVPTTSRCERSSHTTRNTGHLRVKTGQMNSSKTSVRQTGQMNSSKASVRQSRYNRPQRTHSDPNMAFRTANSSASEASSGVQLERRNAGRDSPTRGPENYTTNSENKQILSIDRLPDTGNNRARALPPILSIMPPIDSGTGASWSYNHPPVPPSADDISNLPPPPSYEEVIGVADHN